jgi:predicted nucleic acid-binding protein
MNKSFVDTNIFIEVFSRKGEKSDKCRKLLSEKNSNLVTNTLVLAEVEWVLRSAYEEDKSQVLRCLKKILTSGIEIEDIKPLLMALEIYENFNLDWTDCINTSYMRVKGIQEIFSYDKSLNKIKFIKRIEP